jgi:hypothetical protein
VLAVDLMRHADGVPWLPLDVPNEVRSAAGVTNASWAVRPPTSGSPASLFTVRAGSPRP